MVVMGPKSVIASLGIPKADKDVKIVASPLTRRSTFDEKEVSESVNPIRSALFWRFS
jgi:hypothetical protein